MRHLSKLLPLLVVLSVAGVVTWAARGPLHRDRDREDGAELDALQPIVALVNAEFADRWQREQVTSAPPAPDLQVLRRLTLALVGSNPSLEEIRQFEADKRPDRLDHWTRRLLADKRFADYFGERLARGFVGTEGGQFIIYRRDRFVAWLSEQLQNNTPYDGVVRTLISQQGLWTGQPATNFVTAAITDGAVDENKLTGKTVRAFLGQRIDCAQCHNHPFDHWRQREFEGLAAFYGQVQQTMVGIEDKEFVKGKPLEFMVEDRETLEKRTVTVSVPFHSEWLPQTGTRRERLAAWITHPENRRFERAIANRVWALLFGRAYLEPVDDLRDPPPEEKRDLLDLLGRDFREHRYDLKRLVQVIAASTPFKLDSVDPARARDDETESASPEPGRAAPESAVSRAEAHWAAFPLVRLRPEQVVGSILQSASLQTVDQNSHLFVRLVRLINENNFLKQYGDLGENELLEQGGTIPQRLLLMNGNLAGEFTKTSPLYAAGRIETMAATDEKCIETAYLVCLTRRPAPEEQAHFLEQLRGKKRDARQRIVSDLFWSLFNSTEFSWNH